MHGLPRRSEQQQVGLLFVQSLFGQQLSEASGRDLQRFATAQVGVMLEQADRCIEAAIGEVVEGLQCCHRLLVSGYGERQQALALFVAQAPAQLFGLTRVGFGQQQVTAAQLAPI